MISGPELKHSLLHLLDTFRVPKPPFGSVVVGVVAEDAPIALHDPSVYSDDCAARDGLATDRSAGLGDDALVVEAEGGVQAKRFLDAGVEVGQGVGVSELGGAEHVGWVFGREVRVKLLLQFGVASRGSEEVVEECCECYSADNTQNLYQLEMKRESQVAKAFHPYVVSDPAIIMDKLNPSTSLSVTTSGRSRFAFRNLSSRSS